MRARTLLVFLMSLLAGAPMHAFAALRENAALAQEIPAARQCLKALAPMDADSVPDSGKFEQTDCDGKTDAAFRYDQTSGFTRAIHAIAAGQIVPSYPEFAADMVRPGQRLQLVVTLGAAHVERQVVAMQSARAGQRLFVRSSDGQIMSVRFEGGAQ